MVIGDHVIIKNSKVFIILETNEAITIMINVCSLVVLICFLFVPEIWKVYVSMGIGVVFHRQPVSMHKVSIQQQCMFYVNKYYVCVQYM